MACALFYLGPVAARWFGGAAGRRRIRMGKAIALSQIPRFSLLASRVSRRPVADLPDAFWKLAAAISSAD